jgi:microcompartment protein CcmK/EutM
MIYGRVIGTVVSTVKHPQFVGEKLLMVQPLDEQSKDDGESFLAVDNAQAGVGDKVLVLSEGNGIRQIMGSKQNPVRRLIIGIVDCVDSE